VDQRIIIVTIFIALFTIPITLVSGPIIAGLELLSEYAREHVLLCLIPAFLIAGAIAAFINKGAIMRVLGSKAKPALAYGIASVSGAIMTVCSCTVLPLFAGIRTRGAGLGPAITFLYAGPAINIPAILLSFNVLGYELGAARVIFAIAFSVITGLVMALLFREAVSNKKAVIAEAENDAPKRTILIPLFIALLGVLVVSNLTIEPKLKTGMLAVLIASLLGIVFALTTTQRSSWSRESWDVVLLVAPYLFIGVFIAGVMGAIVPDALIERFVGTNSPVSVLSASLFASLMYFSTLTEIPIIQAFMAKGMAQGPALAMLLAGPSLSLPNLLVIRRLLGWRKTLTYAGIVVVLSTLAGVLFGMLPN
jgi:uncharacterized protein